MRLLNSTMDSIGLEYWQSKLEQHRQNRERLLANRLEILNSQGLLQSGATPLALFDEATEYLSKLVLNWMAIHQDAWTRQNPDAPVEMAQQDASEIKSILDAEETKIYEEISKISTGRSFNWSDQELKTSREKLSQAKTVLVNKCLSRIESLKSIRVETMKTEDRRLQQERSNRKWDIFQAMGIAVLSAILGGLVTNHFNTQQTVLYQAMVDGLRQELAALKAEYQTLVRWTLKTPGEIDREIQRVKEDAEKKAIELKGTYRQKRGTFKMDMAERGISQSSVHDEGLKKLDLEEQEELKTIGTDMKRRIEDLTEQKKKLLSK